MEKNRVSGILFCIVCALLIIQGLINKAQAQAAIDIELFRDTQNKVSTVDGRKFNFTNLVPANDGTYNANVQVLNSDGTTKNVSKNLKVNPNKWSNYLRSCLRSPTVCAASAAITTAVTSVAGWYFSNDDYNIYTSEFSALPDYTSWPMCSDPTQNLIEYDGGSRLVTVRDINCKLRQRTDDAQYIISLGIFPYNDIRYSASRNATLDPVYNDTPFAQVAPTASYLIEYHEVTGFESNGAAIWDGIAWATFYAPNAMPDQVTPPLVPLQDLADIATLAMMEAFEAGKAVDVFDPIELDETSTNPDTDLDYVGGNPSDTELSLFSDIPDEERDVSLFFGGDAMIANAQCPEPLSFDLPIHGSATISFQTFCDISLIIKPIIILSGMLTWLVIVWRGLNGSD